MSVWGLRSSGVGLEFGVVRHKSGGGRGCCSGSSSNENIFSTSLATEKDLTGQGGLGAEETRKRLPIRRQMQNLRTAGLQGSSGYIFKFLFCLFEVSGKSDRCVQLALVWPLRGSSVSHVDRKP